MCRVATLSQLFYITTVWECVSDRLAVNLSWGDKLRLVDVAGPPPIVATVVGSLFLSLVINSVVISHQHPLYYCHFPPFLSTLLLHVSISFPASFMCSISLSFTRFQSFLGLAIPQVSHRDSLNLASTQLQTDKDWLEKSSRVEIPPNFVPSEMSSVRIFSMMFLKPRCCFFLLE